ncbi:MAG TPA: hypothetical protein VE570_10185 [Thermoleophilaceae bacterium]|nr:hypothetical protein [Thermoleophilaceae bacterium]
MQLANASPSNEHPKLAPDSLVEKLKLADGLVVVPAGPELIMVSGGVASTVHARVAGLGSTFPASSRARTLKLCTPSESPS